MTGREADGGPKAASLEAHDNVDIALSDQLFRPGCPLCRYRVAYGRRYLRSLVYEGINDVGFRRTLEGSRGLCGRHTVALFEADREEMGGSLGTAILLESVLRHRLHELVAGQGELRRDLGRRLERAAAAPECPACAAEDDGVRLAVDRLVERMADEHWRDALSRARLCLADIVGLARAAATSEARLAAVRPVLDAQLGQLAGLREALADFAHNSTYDRQHRLTEKQHVSAARATEALGSREGWEWRHGRHRTGGSEPPE